MFPGISERTLKKLKKEDADVIKDHIELVRAAAKKKKDVVDGKFIELGEHFKKPKAEVEQFAKLVRKLEKKARVELLAVLLGIEVNTRELHNSIEEELELIKKFEKAKGTKMQQITKEVEKEILVGAAVEHQINLLYSTQKLAHSALEFAKQPEHEKFAKEIGKKCANLMNMNHFIGRVIFDEEVPNLSIIYNLLELEEWKDIEKAIMEIKLKFFEYRPNLL